MLWKFAWAQGTKPAQYSGSNLAFDISNFQEIQRNGPSNPT